MARRHALLLKMRCPPRFEIDRHAMETNIPGGISGCVHTIARPGNKIPHLLYLHKVLIIAQQMCYLLF